MYLAIDVGGTKTLLAAFQPSGKLMATHRFATNPSYKHFKHDLAEELKQQFGSYRFSHAGCAVPGLLDDAREVVVAFGNLKWKNLPIRRELEAMLKLPVEVENDAKLAALSEALLVRDKFNKVLYLTVSTGIGGGVIVNGHIDDSLRDTEPGQMLLEHDGAMQLWEDVVSGKAIVRRFGKRAADINDEATWIQISRDLTLGLQELLAIIQPEAVIIGGGVGSHFKKFGHLLEAELKRHENPMVPIPPIMGAQRPEEAVIYGCYEYIKQRIR